MENRSSRGDSLPRTLGTAASLAACCGITFVASGGIVADAIVVDALRERARGGGMASKDAGEAMKYVISYHSEQGVCVIKP